MFYVYVFYKMDNNRIITEDNNYERINKLLSFSIGYGAATTQQKYIFWFTETFKFYQTMWETVTLMQKRQNLT